MDLQFGKGRSFFYLWTTILMQMSGLAKEHLPERTTTLDLVFVVKPIQDRPLWTLYKDCRRLCIAQSREKHPENDTLRKWSVWSLFCFESKKCLGNGFKWVYGFKMGLYHTIWCFLGLTKWRNDWFEIRIRLKWIHLLNSILILVLQKSQKWLFFFLNSKCWISASP